MLVESFEELQRRADGGIAVGGEAVRQLQRLAASAGEHVSTIGLRQRDWTQTTTGSWAQVQSELIHAGWPRAAELFRDYLIDAWQRGVLTADVLRQRGNIFEAHDAAGAPPVLAYEYDTVMDGCSLKRPVNYMLLAIRPPEGVETHDWKRPYMIIDPRAGHGPGIGGFKPDSQVGVALHGGHPVYFVAFRQHPEPGQTIADVMRAEAAFYKEVVRRHPDAPQPAVVGNCQGGWATLLLAAANPDITGPIVINGAPLAAWSGVNGRHPMRYSGGLLGGALSVLLAADLGAGEFDGANLVMNFETLNPARSFFRKYYDLFADPEAGADRFLEFERWWGGFYFLNAAEIHWILDNIFIGNRLSRGEARLEHGRSIDLKAIRAPIIVFASHGDNITQPQQALNWIVDTYVDEREVKIRGQRIIYMVHESVGHLGIFVSSSTARKEHSEIVSVLKTIETLAPGLYEMTIEEQHGDGQHARFEVDFKERTMADVLALNAGGRAEEADFGAVARLSEVAAEIYDLSIRPLVHAAANPALAETLRALHPMRVQRRAMSDRVPGVAQLGALAEAVHKDRRPAGEDNPFRRAETLWADMVERGFDVYREVRDAWYEMSFFTLYGNPMMRRVGETHNFRRMLKDKDELAVLPEVQAALANTSRGGIPEAIIRMLTLVAEARGAVSGARLERAAYTFTHSPQFATVNAARRARLLREQTLIVLFDRAGALATLSDLLPDMDSRAIAVGTIDYIVGLVEMIEAHTIETLEEIRRALDLPRLRLGKEEIEALSVALESEKDGSTNEAA
jgi:pimeloyl-ACP methyl ester carboxylesterase